MVQIRYETLEGSFAIQARIVRVDLPIKRERYQRVDVDKEHSIHEDQQQTDSCFYGETTKITKCTLLTNYIKYKFCLEIRDYG